MRRNESLKQYRIKTDITFIESSHTNVLPGQNSKFTRRWYFLAEWVDHVQIIMLVFSLSAGLKNDFEK